MCVGRQSDDDDAGEDDKHMQTVMLCPEASKSAFIDFRR
jgi:hypothetical protein